MQELGINRNKLLELHLRFGDCVPCFSGASAQPVWAHAIILFLQPDLTGLPPVCGRPRNVFVLTMPIDPELYLHHLADYDLSKAQKVELIHSISDLMKCAVDQAWARDPVQMSLTARAMDDTANEQKGVQSKQQPLSDEFSPAARGGEDGKA